MTLNQNEFDVDVRVIFFACSDDMLVVQRTAQWVGGWNSCVASWPAPALVLSRAISHALARAQCHNTHMSAVSTRA